MTNYQESQVLVAGLGFPESLRWHDDALWYADWAAGVVYRLRSGLQPELMASRPSFPLCFDLLATRTGPRPLLLSNPDRAVLLAGSPDEEPTSWASLAGLGDHPWNELVLAPDGSAYVNNIGFAYSGAELPSQAGSVGFVVLVRPDGTAERVADGLAFPNGMAIVDDGRTLLVAESWGSRITAYAIDADGGLADRRVWAETPGLHPDGIDAHPDGTVSLADVGTRACVRVSEGGEILDRVELPQPAFDCVVGDLGNGPTLFVAVNTFGDEVGGGELGGEPAGRILGVPLT